MKNKQSNKTRNNINDIETYKLLWDRIDKEIEELYKIHNMYLIVAGALLAISASNLNNKFVHLTLGLLGVIIAISWFLAVTSQEKWKDWWMKELAALEKDLDLNPIWKRVIFKKPDYLRPAPKITSVSNPYYYLFCLFGFISLCSFIYGIFLLAGLY